MIVRLGKQAHPVADSYIFCSRRDSTVKNFWVRTMRVFIKKMVFHTPERVKTYLVTKYGLFKSVFVSLMFFTGGPWLGDWYFVEHGKLH